MNVLHKIYQIIFIFFLVAGVIAQDFDGIKIYINPGHGGNDSDDRYIPQTGYWESEGNLTKGLYLRDILENAGAIVVMSRTLNRTEDDLPLSQISADANANKVDYFHSIHSNGLNGNTYVNRILMLFRGYTDAPVFPEAKEMGAIMWYKMYEANNEWTVGPYSKIPDNQGDWTFYPQWGTSGLGVLRGLAMAGTLSEGSFHDYFPNSFRLMSIDYRKHESIVIFRSFVDFYDLTPMSHGVLAGIVRDKSKSVPYSYSYNSGLPNDQYLALNHARVTLLDENKQYITDFNNNGFYMFDSLAPGEYQVVFEAGSYLADTLSATVTANKTAFLNAFLTESSGKAPHVYASVPLEEEVGVSTAQNIIFTFSQAMNKSTVENAFQIDPSVAGTFSWSNNYSFQFRQTDALQTSSEYTVILDTTAQNLSGIRTTEPFILNFSTAAEHVHPSVKSYYPGADIDSTAITTPIKLTFDTDMRKTETESAFTITPSVTGQFTWNDANTELTFTPDNDLERFTNYTVSLSTGALNSYGVGLSSEFSFTFLTRSKNEINIVRMFPYNNQEQVYPNPVFACEFSSKLNPSVLITDFELRDESGAPLRIKNILVNDRYLRFQPSSQLKTATWYTLTVKPTIQDTIGLFLEDTVKINFRTEDETFAGVVVEDFEAILDWQNPNNNQTTTGVDELNTYFSVLSYQKINGSYAGGLFYSFSGESGGVCRVLNTAGFATTDNNESQFGMWVYGDFSGNVLEFWFDRSSQEQVVLVDTINWAGWKLKKFPVSMVGGSGVATFHSIVLRQVEGALKGDVLYFDDAQYDVVSGLQDQKDAGVSVREYQLYQNYPNPFNPQTTIRYQLPAQGQVKLTIYNILGQVTAELVNQVQKAGQHEISWNAAGFTSGVYFYRLETLQYQQTRKLILLK